MFTCSSMGQAMPQLSSYRIELLRWRANEERHLFSSRALLSWGADIYICRQRMQHLESQTTEDTVRQPILLVIVGFFSENLHL